MEKNPVRTKLNHSLYCLWFGLPERTKGCLRVFVMNDMVVVFLYGLL